MLRFTKDDQITFIQYLRIKTQIPGISNISGSCWCWVKQVATCPEWKSWHASQKTHSKRGHCQGSKLVFFSSFLIEVLTWIIILSKKLLLLKLQIKKRKTERRCAVYTLRIQRHLNSCSVTKLSSAHFDLIKTLGCTFSLASSGYFARTKPFPSI